MTRLAVPLLILLHATSVWAQDETAEAPVDSEPVPRDVDSPEEQAEPEEPPLEVEDSMPEAQEPATCLSGDLFGVVYDPDGEALAEAEVFIEIEGERVRETLSDEEGNYRLARVPAGHHRLAAAHDGELTLTTIILRPDESERVDLRLPSRAAPALGLQNGQIRLASLRPSATTGDNIVAEARTLEVGGQFDAIASNVALGGETLGLTDLVFLSLFGRYSFGILELGLGASFLIKQSSFLDEGVFQDGSLSVRVPILDWLVPVMSGSIGNVTGGGLSFGASAGFNARASVGRFITFDGALTATFMSFNPSAGDAFWLLDAVVSAQAIIHGDRKQAGLGLGARYALPIAHSADPFDPGVSVSFFARAVVNLESQWDIYIEGALIDRGEPEQAQTQLPVLNGGFDQSRVSIGVNHHFEDL